MEEETFDSDMAEETEDNQQLWQGASEELEEEGNEEVARGYCSQTNKSAISFAHLHQAQPFYWWTFPILQTRKDDHLDSEMPQSCLPSCRLAKG